MKRTTKSKKSRAPKGRGRGQSYERSISRLLSLWFTHGERDDCYWRTSGSGGRFSRGEASKYTSGDIACEHPDGMSLVEVFSIELKRYDDFDLFDLIMPYKKRKKGSAIPNDIKLFWKQCADDAQKADKYPWLIMKRNRYKDCMMMSLSFMKATKGQFPYISWQGNFVCHLEHFLEVTNPEVLISTVKNFGI